MPSAPVNRTQNIPIAGMGAQIATTAMKYEGIPYLYGGGNPSGWDCSGFVNWVLGHDLQMILPGSTKPGFTGKMHGPVVTQYALWSKAQTVTAPLPGDLCVFVGVGPAGHIGIALDDSHMISALNPNQGTVVTGIIGEGPPGAPLIYRRVGAAGSLANGCIPFIGMIACIRNLRST